MMAFFMHYYKKSSRLRAHLFLFIFLLVAGFASAEEYSALTIKNADFIEKNAHYRLLTNVEISFGPSVEAALNKGFELAYVLEFQLFRPRKYWFDDEVVTISRPIKLSYHPLSRQYLFSQSGQQQTFSSLEAVKGAFAELTPEPVFAKNILDETETYHAAVKVRLDYKKLPNDLRAEIDDAPEWQMTSQRYQWVPLFFKQ